MDPRDWAPASSNDGRARRQTVSEQLTENRKPMPRMTDRIVKTGFQSSLQAHEMVAQFRWRVGVLPENVQTDVPFEIDVRMVDLLRAFDFGRYVRVLGLDGEREDEAATFVIALQADSTRRARGPIG